MSSYRNDNDNEYGPSDVDLREFDDVFAEAPADSDDRGEIPDGRYQVIVDKVEVTRSKTSNSPMLKWQLRIEDAELAGRLLWKNSMIATEENVKWLKKEFVTCGFHLEKLSDLQSRLPDLLDLKLEVTKRTKGAHANIYFQRLIASSAQNQGGYGGTGDDHAAF
jgi:hypothetical protein